MTATLRGISITGRQATETDDGTEYRYIARVTTDNKNDGSQVVKNTAGLPAIGDLYSTGNDFDPNAVVISKEPRQLESPTEWEVEIVASTNIDEDPAAAIENPLLRPPQYSYGFTTRQINVAGYYDSPDAPPSGKDFDGALVAPNGEPFHPAPVVEYDEPTLQIVKNYATLPAILAINNTVNLTAFEGAEARQLRLRASARTAWHKSVGNYWVVTFIFTYRFETWDIQVPNQGTFYWNSGLPTNPASTTADKDRKAKKVDGRAVLVDLTTAGDIKTTQGPSYTRRRFYREIDFNTLGI